MIEDPWVSYFDLEKYGFVNPANGKPYSRVHIGRLIRRGDWPAPIQISQNRIAWRLSQLRERERRLEIARAYREPADAA